MVAMVAYIPSWSELDYVPLAVLLLLFVTLSFHVIMAQMCLPNLFQA